MSTKPSRLTAVFFGLCLSINGCICGTNAVSMSVKNIARQQKEIKIDRANLKRIVREIATAPHPLGSPRQAQVKDFIIAEVQKLGLTPVVQDFVVDAPNPDAKTDASDRPFALTVKKSGANIIVPFGLKDHSECIVLIGTHYDSKIVTGTEYLGANDSASSTAAVLEIARLTQTATEFLPFKRGLQCDLVGVFFDGEESVLSGWNDGLEHPAKMQDNLYGSRHMVGQLTNCDAVPGKKCLQIMATKPTEQLAVEALVLMDMIGSPNLLLTRDTNSSQPLITIAETAVSTAFDGHLFSDHEKPMIDDHIPFINASIPAINLIDFEHLGYWHAPDDDFEHLSFVSIESALRLAMIISVQSATNPKAIAPIRR